MNVTEIVHVAFGASVAGLTGHVLLWLKSVAFAPVSPKPLIVRGAVPVFVKVVACGALVVDTFCPANVRVAGASDTPGAGLPAPALNASRMFAVVRWIPAFAKVAL